MMPRWSALVCALAVGVGGCSSTTGEPANGLGSTTTASHASAVPVVVEEAHPCGVDTVASPGAGMYEDEVWVGGDRFEPAQSETTIDQIDLGQPIARVCASTVAEGIALRPGQRPPDGWATVLGVGTPLHRLDDKPLRLGAVVDDDRVLIYERTEVRRVDSAADLVHLPDDVVRVTLNSSHDGRTPILELPRDSLSIDLLRSAPAGDRRPPSGEAGPVYLGFQYVDGSTSSREFSLETGQLFGRGGGVVDLPAPWLQAIHLAAFGVADLGEPVDAPDDVAKIHALMNDTLSGDQPASAPILGEPVIYANGVATVSVALLGPPEGTPIVLSPAYAHRTEAGWRLTTLTRCELAHRQSSPLTTGPCARP